MEAQYALAKLWEAHAPERSAQEIDRAFMRAYWLAPHRIEPLFALVQRMRVRGDHFQAYLLASMALMRLHADPDKSEHGVPRAAQLFVQQWQYESGLATELGLAAARMGDWEHAERVLESVTQVPSLRDAHGGDADVVRGNLAYVRRAKWGAQDEAERERERLCESLF